MLYQAIREACGKYHSSAYGWDYDCALKAYHGALKKRQKSANPEKPSYEEAAILLSFANGWSARMQCKVDDVQWAIEKIQPYLDALKGKSILDVCLDERNRELICRSFKVLAGCNRKGRNEATGASKILHIINPKLFVMWDGAIRTGYICKLGKTNEGWIWYTEFLQAMQNLAKCAIDQVVCECGVSYSEATESLTCSGHTLAKTLDEYNFMKYTKTCGSVWQAEYEPCSVR